MSNAVVEWREQIDVTAIENVIAKGDLSQLSPVERVAYYVNTCRSLGLNPMTKPFDFIKLNGTTQLYATRGATDQLRDVRGVNIVSLVKERVDDLFMVTATAELPDGRRDTATGVVAIGGLRGNDLANALMKAETKAKRRVTLSICGLGWMDETEVGTVRDARPAARQYTSELIDAGVVGSDYVTDDVEWQPQPHPEAEPFHAFTGTGQPPTERQTKYLWATAREKGWTRDHVFGLMHEWWGDEIEFNALTRQQVSALIERVTSGPLWVDPRQQRMEMPAPPVVDADGVIVDAAPASSDDDLATIADIHDLIEGARSAAELNDAWKRAIECNVNRDQHLFGLYERRMAELSGR